MIYVVRHCQAEGQAPDASLTAEGRRQAEAAVIVTHGNLMTLLLKRFDHRFGFAEWRALSNPDVYLVSDCVQRLWLAGS
ncbi:MAG TPA: hypothetical protein VNT75_02140 [Symbiobacteriaceae bacterium]|nr:hypothetical protein [Symbiobacteriaceae bacterium]